MDPASHGLPVDAQVNISVAALPEQVFAIKRFKPFELSVAVGLAKGLFDPHRHSPLPLSQRGAKSGQSPVAQFWHPKFPLLSALQIWDASVQNVVGVGGFGRLGSWQPHKSLGKPEA